MEALYLAKNSPNFKVKVGPKVKLQASKGVLHCPEEHVAALDALIRTRNDIRANLTKIDLKKAEETVKAHQAKERKQGVAGPFASNNGPEGLVQSEKNNMKNASQGVGQNPDGSVVEAVKEMMPAAAPLTVTEMPQADAKPKGVAAILAGQTGRFGAKK